MSKFTKQQQLDQIAAEIVVNNVCPNLAQTAKQLVLGNGNPDADIVFIGEAPGKKEDETGLPFVGAAGKFLDEMLGSVQLDRAGVYITNIVKYRPPDNRDPSLEEKQEFLPYLIEQIEIIDPKIIIPLGRHSMDVFLRDVKISEVHGKRFDINMNSIQDNCKIDSRLGKLFNNISDKNIVILPLYHPAAALYNGGLREILLRDFTVIPQIIKNIK